METCSICLEKTHVQLMLSLHDCLHKRCSSCAKKHLEVKLYEGTAMPTCPQQGCNSSINMRECKKVLRPKLVKLLEQRMKESQIPVLDRIYCPYPKCSNLMSIVELSAQRNGKGCRECLKCGGEFCDRCKVPWHDDLSCSEYKMLHPYSCAEEQLLISLAKTFSWRWCIKCSHMIELSSGCYHMICRCGYQFCYLCESEWREKKPCGCPLWDERHLLY